MAKKGAYIDPNRADVATRFGAGNQLWRKNINPGQPPSYTPDGLWEKAQEYFDWCVDNPHKEQGVYGKDATVVEVDKMRAFTIMEFCTYAGIAHVTFRSYAKHPAYSKIVHYIEQIIYSQKFSGAAAGLLNPNIIARDLGLVDKKEVKTEDTHVHLYVPDNGRQIAQPVETQELTEGEDFSYIPPPELVASSTNDKVQDSSKNAS